MALTAIAFYLLAAVTLLAGIAVVSAKNPVHSVLFLITAFFSAAGLFVLMGAEFLAMLLVVVYVGAVAVLFLFVVMMLDVDFAELRQGFARYLPVALAVAGVLVVEMTRAPLDEDVPGEHAGQHQQARGDGLRNHARQPAAEQARDGRADQRREKDDGDKLMHA
jgi:hypothetical protein